MLARVPSPRWLFAATAAFVGLCGAACFAWLAAHGVHTIRPPRGYAETNPHTPADPHDWPTWRGPHADGMADTDRPPLRWSSSESIVWRVPVPGRGHASPVVCGERVFLATADEERRVQSVLCHDRATGTRLWQTTVHEGRFGEKHEKNSHASATPACDGRRLYTVFAVDDAVWVSAVDLDGRVVWRRRIAPFVSQFGFGSSPVLFGRLVIVAAESAVLGPMRRLQKTSCLAALDGETGELVWRVLRPDATSCGTPTIGRVAGRWQLVLAGPTAVVSYDPSTSAELWRYRWKAQRTANTVAFDDRHVFASAVLPDKELVCIRADGSGDVTDSHAVWTSKRGVPDVPSPLCDGTTLFTVEDGGVLNAFRADSGKLLQKRRLPGTFSASPVAAGGHLFACNEEGTTYVLGMEAPWNLLAENPLGESVLATPAISREAIFIRTAGSLVCIAATTAASAPSPPPAPLPDIDQ